jgi:hypothetical protein
MKTCTTLSCRINHIFTQLEKKIYRISTKIL